MGCAEALRGWKWLCGLCVVGFDVEGVLAARSMEQQAHTLSRRRGKKGLVVWVVLSEDVMCFGIFLFIGRCSSCVASLV